MPYCSTTASWRGTHISAIKLKSNRANLDGIPSSHTVGDFRFIRKIISNDIRKNAQLLKMLLEDELSRSSPLEVAIHLHYGKVPVEMTVISVHDINVPGESGWGKLIEASVSRINRHGMMVVSANVQPGAAIWIELCPVLIPVDCELLMTV